MAISKNTVAGAVAAGTHQGTTLEDMLQRAITMFEEGEDGGREGMMRYLQVAARLIESVQEPGKRLTFPLYVMIDALRSLDENHVHPIIRPKKVSHRSSPSRHRELIIACAVIASDTLLELKLPLNEANRKVAAELERQTFAIQSRGRVTAKTLEGWRRKIRDSARGTFLRDTYDDLYTSRYIPDPSHPISDRQKIVLSDFSQLVERLRAKDVKG